MDAGETSFTLGNGLTVHLSPVDGEALVSLSASVGAGLLTERGWSGGISHFVEHLVFKGDGTTTADELIDRVSACGGSLNAYTFFDNTSYEATVPAGDLAVPLDVLSRLIFDPAFPDGEVETERKVVLEEIARENDAPDDLLFDLQGALFYGDDHPYGKPILGTAASIRALGAGEVRAYHRDRYVPGNVTLAVAGGFDPAGFRPLVERFFGRAASRPSPPVPAADLLPLRPRPRFARHPYPGAESGYGLAGWPAPQASSPDYAAMNVAASLLGFGDNSFLNRRLCLELALTASADVIYSPRRGPAQLLVAFAYEPGDEEAILRECRGEVARLRAGDFGDEEFDSAVTKLEADHVFGLEQTYVRADGLALAATVDHVDRYRRAVEALGAVTRADVLRVAAEWLAAEPVVVLVDPAEAEA